jgi:hypothetical protein
MLRMFSRPRRVQGLTLGCCETLGFARGFCKTDQPLAQDRPLLPRLVEGSGLSLRDEREPIVRNQLDRLAALAPGDEQYP